MAHKITVGDYRATDIETSYVLDVLRTGRLSRGPYTLRFEAEWARLHGCKTALFCNSGTSALHVAVAALKARHGWKDGDEIIVPATTFVATANVAIHNNLVPVFCDVRTDTYNIDPGLIEKHITPRTRAIIPVHLTGLPADMPAIMAIANAHNLRVIEDSCETTFASVAGKKVGSWGDVGCFSTYVAHYIVTGVGGLMTTNDAELAASMLSLVNHGRDGIYITIDDDKDLTGAALKEVISRRFHFVDVGHSFRATELEAAIGLGQLGRWPSIVSGRKRVATGYRDGLQTLSHRIQLPYAPKDCEHVFMMFPLVVLNAAHKALLTQYLEERGVETRDLLPLINQPIYKKLYPERNLAADNPVAQWLIDRAFYIGCHQYITDDDVAYVVSVIHDFFREHK